MRILLWPLTILTLLLTQLSHASDAQQNLQRLLQPIHSFSADFEQLILDKNGTRMQSTQGQVQLKKPGQFRWETLQPFPQLIVSDGQTLWMYDEDLEQVTQQKVDQRVSQTPALLLSGEDIDLGSHFEVSGPLQGDEGIFRLMPKDENALYSVIRILFVAGTPTEMQMEDNLGQQTSLQFANIERNPELSDDLFSFEIPPGVDLIVE